MVSKVLLNLSPKHIFSSEKLLVAGEHRVTAIRTDAICYVDLNFDVAPDWSHEAGREISSITEEEFAAAARPGGEFAAKRGEQTGQSEINAHVEMQLPGGHRLFLAARGPNIPDKVRSTSLLRALDAPCIWSRLGETGFRLVNASKLTYVSSYPGPPEVPATAIHARRLD
jgi:hypothetical protein